MKIKQDPVTGLFAREDGAILLPPTSRHSNFKKYRWTFGYQRPDGYRMVGYRGKRYPVHPIVCRAFHGLPSEGKPEVDHINRIRDDNRPCNLHWTTSKENNANKDCVDKAFEKYGVRACEDKKAYMAARAAEKKAQGLVYRKGPGGKKGWYPFKRM